MTLTGGDTVLTTETFTTAGVLGDYRLGAVPVPGTYALTFALDGRVTETVQAVLTLEDPAATADVVLRSALGRIAGVVLDDLSGQPLGAVTVEVSDGETTRATTTASEPLSQRGRFVVGQLEPGSYTVTATTTGGSQRTLLRTVTAGQTTDLQIRVGASP